jgi:hypothetical protein
MPDSGEYEDGVAEAIETFTKLAPLPLFVLSTSSAVCLFARDSFVAKLGLLDFRNAHRGWVGLAFLLSTTYLIGIWRSG